MIPCSTDAGCSTPSPISTDTREDISKNTKTPSRPTRIYGCIELLSHGSSVPHLVMFHAFQDRWRPSRVRLATLVITTIESRNSRVGYRMASAGNRSPPYTTSRSIVVQRHHCGGSLHPTVLECVTPRSPLRISNFRWQSQVCMVRRSGQIIPSRYRPSATGDTCTARQERESTTTRIDPFWIRTPPDRSCEKVQSFQF